MVIKIDTLSPVPIYMQLRNQVILGIAAKKLETGEALPSARRLSADLGINLHTVNKAYALLINEGYVAFNRSRGTFVSQPVKTGDEVTALISDNLCLAAAEAICHSVNEKEFLNMCQRNYIKAQAKTEVK